MIEQYFLAKDLTEMSKMAVDIGYMIASEDSKEKKMQLMAKRHTLMHNIRTGIQELLRQIEEELYEDELPKEARDIYLDMKLQETYLYPFNPESITMNTIHEPKK